VFGVAGLVDSRSATAWLEDWLGVVVLVFEIVGVSVEGVDVAVLRSSVHQP
jgi:hypothetical protein